MEQLEQELKELILKKYESINRFAQTIGIPNSTVGNILNRGVKKANISNIFAICGALEISIDELAKGRIAEATNKLQKEIAKNIKFYRKFNGYSIEELAKKIKVSPEFLDDWERRMRVIDMDTLHKICKVLGVSIIDMFGKFATQPNDTVSSEEKKNILKVRQMNEEGKKYVVRQIDYALQQEEYLLKREESKKA